MYNSTSTSSELLPRGLLLRTLLYHPQSAPPPSSGISFDANVVRVLSVLLFALICSLGINSIIRCCVRCSRFHNSERNNSSIQLAKNGMKKKALNMFPIVRYGEGIILSGLDTECVICLSQYANGEVVRVLPKCNHGFHVRCIDKWLKTHSSCPTCRQCLSETCQKITCPSVSLQQETVLTIAPVEPEGLVHSYRM